MIIRHLHLPNITRYSHAGRIQERLVAQQLAFKANPSAFSHPPHPTIITAQFAPVYTCGRREVGSVSAAQKSHLTASTPFGRHDHGDGGDGGGDGGEHVAAEFHEALRGGQTTFHGPGQLVAYPVLDLKSQRLTPRTYVCLLEKSVIATCAWYGVEARRTENPGVWVTDEEKICAVGVHLRRNVTSHGIGLNVNTDLRWFERIVACGLEGKRTTSLARQGVESASVESVAKVFVGIMAESLSNITEVREVTEIDMEAELSS